MARSLLTVEELLVLDGILIEAYEFFRKLRASHPTAEYIHYPSVPAEIGESLTVHCTERFFGSDWMAKLGMKRTDSDIILERQGEQRTVEVKTTGQTNFQEFKPKDLRADFLVWMDFGDRYIKGGGKLNIYILRNPQAYFHTPLRLKLPGFLSRVGSSPDLRHIEAASLRDLLDANLLHLDHNG